MAEKRELRKITQVELDAILVEHEKWLDSDGKEGARADLSYADLSKKALPDAFKTHKRLTKADLSKAHLQGARLREAHLEEADLRGAHLERAILRKARMERANLRRAHLERAILPGAHLEGTILKRADFRNTDLAWVKYDSKIKCRGVRLDGCHGSPRFERFLRDQDYVEEFQARHKKSYFVWWLLADCGRSTLRWTSWSLGLVALFAVTYGWLGPEHFKLPVETSLVDDKKVQVVTGLAWGPLACLYYSIVTFSTLGFGDITPRSGFAACFVMAEVVLGYIMLGGMISLLSNKLARRS